MGNLDRKFDSIYFGDVTLKYKMKDLDGTNLEEIVVVYDENEDKIGEIFGVKIEDVDDNHIHDTCDYGQEFN